jgi:AAA domain
MSLRIIEPTEVINVQHLIMLLSGQPGICKTSLAFSAENAILLNYDTKTALARAVNRGPSINVQTIELQEQLEKDYSIIEPFDTVIIDPVGELVNLMKASIMKENPKLAYAGDLIPKGWGTLGNRFRTWMTTMRAMQKNLLFISHNKEDKSGDTVYNRPDIAGGSKDQVIRLCDFVGFIYMLGRDRILDFNPTDTWFGKNPAQWPAFRIPAPEKARTFMAQLFKKGREALSQASEASAIIANQVDDWRAAIETFTKLDEFNKAVPEILTLNATALPQVAHLIRTRGKACGFEYDVNRKLFYVAKAAEEVLVTL